MTNANSGAQQSPTQNKEDIDVQKAQLEIERERQTLEGREITLDVHRQAMAVQTTFMNPSVWTQIRAMAKVFHEAKALPSSITNEPQLVMVLQAGFEMGMTPIESIKSLYIVNGSINVYGSATTKRLRAHGWRVEYKDETVDSCTAVVTKGDESYEETMTYQMAEKSGYTKSSSGLKVGWKEGLNRKLKLRYGSLSIIIKTYIPEVLGSANDIAEIAMDAPVELPEQTAKQVSAPAASENPIKPSSLADKLAAKHAPKTPEVAQTEDTVKDDTKVGEVEKQAEQPKA